MITGYPNDIPAEKRPCVTRQGKPKQCLDAPTARARACWLGMDAYRCPRKGCHCWHIGHKAQVRTG